MPLIQRICLLTWFICCLPALGNIDRIGRYEIIYDAGYAQVAFAVQDIKAALKKEGLSGKKSDGRIQIVFKVEAGVSEPDGFEILNISGNQWMIRSAGANGLMYGGLELAEQLTFERAIQAVKLDPFIAKRGIKMNIPLDARTPSYDDTGDAAQMNIETVWDWAFWEEYFDHMARYRYNVLTLWNPHPFPSMVKLDHFPDVALDDVQVTTLDPVENPCWGAPQLVTKQVVENVKVVKTISIKKKIRFWQKVLKRAKDRGVDVYFFTWNVCPNGAANPIENDHLKTWHLEPWDEPPGLHGITHQMDNPINLDYYRESVRTFLETYPEVKGIGVTAGEHMTDEVGAYTRDQWMWEAYGLGMMDVMEKDKHRELGFIHRVWNTDMDKVMSFWKDYPGSFDGSFKYARARLYSSAKPPFAEEYLKKMEHYGLKSWWNLRNDDIFVHRWGDPEYVRDFIANFDQENTAGFYMGSDGYVWAREFVAKDQELAGRLEFEKHWYKFMLWGRLAYQNDLSEAFFVGKLEKRFPEIDGQILYRAWAEASKVIPLVNRYHWQNWDFQWAVEGCMAADGFLSVIDFIDNPTIEEGGLLSPNESAEYLASGEVSEKVSGLEVAKALHQFADDALAQVKELHGKGRYNDPETQELLEDIESMAWLGNYYGYKIEAAVRLAAFKKSAKTDYQKQAIRLLKHATDAWKQYANISSSNYKPQVLARTQTLDWNALTNLVKNDVKLAKALEVESE